MFGTIRKHQTWLWVFIIAVMIIGLVQFFNPSSRFSSGAGGYERGSINGQHISEEDYMNAYREVLLQFFLRYGRWPDNDAKSLGFDPQLETYRRLFFVYEIKNNNIAVDSQSAARVANNILRQFGNGSAVSLEAFTEKVLAPRGISAEDFERFFRHELGIQQLVSVVGTSGKLVTPAEAQNLYIRERQEISASAAFFNASNYLANFSAMPSAALAQFYTNQMSAYRIPDRVQVSYVAFWATNYFADADAEIARQTNMTEIVDQVYRQRGTNYDKEGLTADQAKTKIRAEIRQEIALNAAAKAANTFATELFDKEPRQAGNLATFAKDKGFAVKVSAPFDEENGPADFDAGPNIGKTAFALNEEEPFGGPLAGKDAVYVLALDKKIPSEIPPLEKIRSQVESDFRLNQAVTAARRAGMLFALAATNGLAQGKSFETIAASNKVKVVTLPLFSLGTRELPEVEDQISLTQLKQIVFDTPVGKSSPFVATREGGVVVFVRNLLPIDQAKMQAELPAFTKSIRQSRESVAINLWFGREFSRAMIDTPLAQARQTSMASGRPGSQ